MNKLKDPNGQQSPFEGLCALQSDFSSEIAISMHKFKEDLLKQIMKQVLGRDAKITDAHDFEFIKHESFPQREFIGHTLAGLLGEIKMITKFDNVAHCMGLEFIPMKEFPKK